MNHLREEHRVQLNRRTPRDSFTGLWEQIARHHHFLKLRFPFSDRSPTKEEITDALSHQDGAASPYSSRVIEDYHVIYDRKGVILLTNTTSMPALGTFFATEDTHTAHRYFIGFAFRVGPLTESITGLIAYFDERGYCHSDRTILCSCVLATYDQRNGLIRGSNTVLYNQTLLFTQAHRDSRKLMLYLSYLPYKTEIIEDHVYYYTNIELPYEALFRETIHTVQRFLCVPKKDRSTLLLDMGSLFITEYTHQYNDIIQQTQRQMVFDTYTLTESTDTLSFLEVAHLFPEKEYSDGYPLFCIRCHEKVVAATYTAKTAPMTATFCGLGSGYCSTCRIRFSASKDAWVCAEIRLDGSICQGYLHEYGECHTGHLHSVDQTLVTLVETPLLKYPFRQKIQVQWVPSEDALACARSTKILEADTLLLQCDDDCDDCDDDDDDLFKEESEVI